MSQSCVLTLFVDDFSHQFRWNLRIFNGFWLGHLIWKGLLWIRQELPIFEFLNKLVSNEPQKEHNDINSGKSLFFILVRHLWLVWCATSLSYIEAKPNVSGFGYICIIIVAMKPQPSHFHQITILIAGDLYSLFWCGIYVRSNAPHSSET